MTCYTSLAIDVRGAVSLMVQYHWPRLEPREHGRLSGATVPIAVRVQDVRAARVSHSERPIRGGKPRVRGCSSAYDLRSLN